VKSPGNCLDQIIDVIFPVAFRVDRHAKIVSECEMKAFDDCLSGSIFYCSWL
jgi:hypothetical protein